MADDRGKAGKHPGGRPRVIDEIMADKILEKMKEGYPLSQVCNMPDMPVFSTVWLKIKNDPVFSKNYHEAREIGLDRSFGDMLAECKLAIDDDPKKAAAWKLYIDTKKWTLSKQLPKKYGDKQEIEHSGGVQVVYLPNEAKGL